MKKQCLSIILSMILFSSLFSPSYLIAVEPISTEVSAIPSISFEKFMTPEPIVEAVPETIDITLTRYYPSDSTGSDTCMATMCTNRLTVNEKGWYTFENKIVIAAATYACLKWCGFSELPSDYRIYEFYDEIQFELEGTIYTGIILDSCGACMYHINGETLQRYDIFTESGKVSSSLLKNSNVGKTSGKLIVNSTED